MHRIQRMLLVGMLGFLWGCSGSGPPSPNADLFQDIKQLGNSISQVEIHTRERDVATAESLNPGQVGLSSEEGGQYRLSITSGSTLLVGAIQVAPFSLNAFPRISVGCPTGSGGSNLINSLESSGMAICTPQSSAEVQVSMEYPGSAALFTLLINQSMQSTFDSLNLVGVPLAANAAQLYRINNTSTDVKQRRLIFRSASSSSAALLYREDGRLICSSLDANTCGVYDDDWSHYYLVVFNADATNTTYEVRFSS
ncbi:hypothetical protein [Candidatus Oscillochloris fontis]|uniref:hypothetical protein n=1 Tax=Candidatus Oscillochloris fontis TaxID=2496868 RepID=UPI00101C0CA0|nr:hypothetical protein [Candidatus Oscillochloris fontis]